MARPSSYSVEVADTICERLAEGKSLNSICASDDMPHKATVFRWLSSHDEFRDQYARAREAQADVLFDEILDIANTPIEGTKTKLDKDGEVVEISKGDMIEHRRLQIDARKWMAGKLRPKVYGDKLDVDLTGALDFVVNAKPMTEEEWQKQHGANPS
ncbi:terminase small subunit protein [Rhizobium pusense]|uniref:terminase small subunit-like protein n=1 Tax=Agrobacterium pusense TaxID=648995 RepID=UPI00244AF9BD|nr:terminase small subunit protein [Agrobacterium pusense]MDH0114064.1 terminase small subunit protein [Agrobacterium pusense]